ncbi:MAG: two-component system, OmpR family, sensor histidine kinase KdpD [Alphaproteobacteria bacterium]|nr:two-component system, OmpR family, sensor histidine kinase KdpD [Alphaproteobacteria bacterium]MEA2971331.1 two-component system, OmpR family, sensor histidine kinase KdpD [Alphaproteobacteria bacterium]
MVRMEAVRRELRGSALALVLVAATTLVAYVLIQSFDVRRGSVIYLLPVLLAGWHLGLVPALVAAVAGVLWSGYFFFSPYYSFYLARPNEILNLLLFMVVAVVTSHLANSMKKHTEVARKSEKDMSDLYAFSRRLASSSSAADIYLAIEEHLASLVQRKVVLFGAVSDSDRAIKPEQEGLSQRVHSAIAEVRAGRTLATIVDDGAGDIWLVRRVSQKNADFGVIAIDLGSVPPSAVEEVRHRVDDVLSDAAATLERLDVARALNDAKMRSETELLREALIGSVSHELRTPLASILGAATVLSKSPVIAKDERLNALAGVVRDEAERLNNDIQNLLDATRISREQIRPRQEWIEPQDIVNSALERRRRRLSSHSVSLDMDSNLPLIYVDAVLVEQAFVQIVDNAAKYSPSGSPIVIAAKRNGRDVVLSVQDQGVGLTVEENAQLGERFFRGARHAATTSGSGLGLWIAKAFVSANGGKIQAVSPGADHGAAVSILLPFATPESQPEVGPDD